MKVSDQNKQIAQQQLTNQQSAPAPEKKTDWAGVAIKTATTVAGAGAGLWFGTDIGLNAGAESAVKAAEPYMADPTKLVPLTMVLVESVRATFTHVLPIAFGMTGLGGLGGYLTGVGLAGTRGEGTKGAPLPTKND